MRLPVLVLWWLCHVALVQRSQGQNVNLQDCEMTDGSGTTEYQACQAAQLLYNLNILSKVDPVDHTCGYGQTLDENVYCTLDLLSQCNLCNASNYSLSHPPEFSYDQPIEGHPTWWQSISWYNYPIPLEVNLTLSFNQSHTINTDIRIVFQSSLPRRMVLEKSSDYGRTWQPYQYYADNCDFYFQMAATDEPSTPTAVFCSESYSIGPQKAPEPGVVLFKVDDRLALLRVSPSLEYFQQAYENNTELKAFLEVTDLRLRLLYPGTDGLEWTNQYLSLIQYYYAISNIDTILICNCNLHGRFCYQDGNSSETVCQCFHNTMGKNCEQCLPLYNNRPWSPGSTLPFPGGTANECEKCTCNDHSDRCTYSDTLGRGACDDCRDNTAGVSCEICVSGYYRDTTVLAHSLNSCIECNCEPLGTVENDTDCSQYVADGKPIGQCNCRDNVEGRACDVCVDQYYGLLLNDGLGTCKDCNCNLLGTINASNVCEKQVGACPCKPGTDTRTCGECKDMYYGYPTTESEDCSACDCDPGGSTSFICNKVSGRCLCRSNITDRQCSDTDEGFYFEYLDSNRYDAWEADSDCDQTSAVSVDLFTGRGFQKCYQGKRVTFRDVTAVSSLGNPLLYRPAIRYTYRSTSPWRQALLSVVVAQPTVTPSLCPVAASTSISALVISLSPGTATAWYASEGEALMLDQRCSYDFTLTLNDRGAGAQEIEIDGLVVLPATTSFSVYTQADSTTMGFYADCMSNMTAAGTRQSAIDKCQKFMFAVSAETNDGAVECDCDPTGTNGSICNSYGGDCNCKSGVGGRRCDHCLPGYFGFTTEGCTRCNCDATGSLSLACNFSTGQCPCKSGVALDGQPNDAGSTSDRQCRSCLANHYGFSTGGGCLACNCNTEGSRSLQCSETGVCPCKETIAGNKCSNCVPGYYLFSADGCTPCSCNLDGSTSITCHPDAGSCSCKSSVQGAKCDQCRLGHFNLQAANPNGCQPCFCYGHGRQCNVAPNYVASTITDAFPSSLWPATDPSAVTVNRISHPVALPGGSYVYLLAPQKYLGRRLELYGQRFSYTMKLDTGTVDNTTDQYLIVSGGRSNMAVYYTDQIFTPTLTERRFEATFYEFNFGVVGVERAPTVNEFQEILSAITSLQIRASFGPSTVSSFYEVSMDTAEYVTNPEDFTRFVSMVEQCSCDVGTMGLSCEQCQQGTYRQNSVDTPFDSCLPCDCNGRATTCDPLTGVCQGCQLGTEGDHCQNCSANVREPLCDRCLPDHYGFGTSLFGGACSACNCNVTGSGGATQCDVLTGQCPCTGNYGGVLCDSCQFNYYNYLEGCLRCDMCYDSISAQHTDLLHMTTNLTSFVDMLHMADTASVLGPFYDRLMATYNQMMQLVERTNIVVTEGDTLTSTVASLNTTMHQLLASLAGAIKAGTETAEQNLASTEALIDQALEAIVGVNQALVGAYSGLTSGDIRSTQSVMSRLTTDLSSIESQLSAMSSSVDAQESLLSQKVSNLTGIAETTVQTAEGALMTAQQAQAIHDNTTSHTAALVTKANQVTDLGQQTRQTVTEVRLRAEEAKTAGEDGKEGELSARIQVLTNGTEAAIEDALAKSGTAIAIEAQAVARQAANAHIISELADVGSQTASLVADAATTLNDANARHNRSLAANQSASDAVASSEATFTAAEEMLTVVQNFDNQSSGAQTAADEALLKQPDIQVLNTATITKAIELRGQLAEVTTDAQEGLNKANQALLTAQAEGQSISSVSQRATQLANESTTNLQDTNQTAHSVGAINTTQLKPARAQCDTYSPELQSLENAVMQANTEAQIAADAALASRAMIETLLDDVRNIQQADLTDMPGLMDRIRQARAAFTLGDFAQLVASLAESVQEQQAWLDTTQAQVTEMQAQIDALQSFSVT